MTGAQTLAAFRRALLPALAVGLAVMALVVGVLLSRPPSYSARVSVVAASNTGSKTVSGDFGAVVTMTMQALPELAVSDGTIKAIRDQVPNAPDAAVLRKAITVELVPASGVARISVTTDNQSTTLAVLQVVLAQITKADLLAPVATLKTIGLTNASAQLVERDPKLALGLGLFAAIVASLLTVVLVQAVRPRLLTPLDVERVVDDVFEDGPDTPAVVDMRAHSPGLNLLAAHLLAQNSAVTEVTVVPTGPPWRGDLARQLRNTLRNLKVSRDVGLPADPFVHTGSGIFGKPRRWVGNGATPFGLPGVGRSGGRPAGASASQSANGTADQTTEPALGTAALSTTSGELASGELSASLSSAPLAGAAGGRRGFFTGPISTTVTGAGGSGGNARETGGNEPSHLIVTVRLGRTTPVALTTALIALRTHGTGVSGVAVS